MKNTIETRDLVAAILVLLGGVIVFARLESYSWWLIGSWTSALIIVSLIGLGVLLTDVKEVYKTDDFNRFLEVALWLTAATVALGSIFSTTTATEFIATATIILLAWLVHMDRHAWKSWHNTKLLHHGG